MILLYNMLGLAWSYRHTCFILGAEIWLKSCFRYMLMNVNNLYFQMFGVVSPTQLYDLTLTPKKPNTSPKSPQLTLKLVNIKNAGLVDTTHEFGIIGEIDLYLNNVLSAILMRCPAQCIHKRLNSVVVNAF